MHGMYNPNHPDGRAETGEPTMHTDWRAKVPGTAHASRVAATNMAFATECTDGFHYLDPESQVIALREAATAALEEDATLEKILGKPAFGIVTAEDIIRAQRKQLEQEIQGTAGNASNLTPTGPGNRAIRRLRVRNAGDYGSLLGRREVKQALQEDFIDS